MMGARTAARGRAMLQPGRCQQDRGPSVSILALGVALFLICGAVGLSGCSGSKVDSNSATASAAAQGLFDALRATSIADSQLPSGFSHARGKEVYLSDRQQQYNALGSIQFQIQGPDESDGIAFTVLPTANE